MKTRTTVSSGGRPADQTMQNAALALERLVADQERLALQGQQINSDLTQLFTRLDRQSDALFSRLQDVIEVMARANATMQRAQSPMSGTGEGFSNLASGGWGPSQEQINSVFARAVRRGLRGL